MECSRIRARLPMDKHEVFLIQNNKHLPKSCKRPDTKQEWLANGIWFRNRENRRILVRPALIILYLKKVPVVLIIMQKVIFKIRYSAAMKSRKGNVLPPSPPILLPSQSMGSKSW